MGSEVSRDVGMTNVMGGRASLPGESEEQDRLGYHKTTVAVQFPVTQKMRDAAPFT